MTEVKDGSKGISERKLKYIGDRILLVIEDNGNTFNRNAYSRFLPELTESEVQAGLDWLMRNGFLEKEKGFGPKLVRTRKGYERIEEMRNRGITLDNQEKPAGEIKYKNTNEHEVLTVMAMLDGVVDCKDIAIDCGLNREKVSRALSSLHKKSLVSREEDKIPYKHWVTKEGFQELESLPQYGDMKEISKGIQND